MWKIFLVLVLGFSNLIALDSQRDTLWIVNDTHRDEGGGGRSLYILWEGDAYHTADKPRQTYSLDPGQQDSRDSKYIGNGDNFRNYMITLRRIRNGEQLEVGKFTHSIYNGPLADGHEERTTIFKNYTADKVELWREYLRFGSGDDDSVYRVVTRIGSVPRDQW